MNLPRKLFHYSGHEIYDLKSDFHQQLLEQWPSEMSMKPCGLWISIEDFEDDMTWRTWCENEEFRLESLKYRYDVKLKPSANILYLDTPEKIIEFGVKNAANDPFDFRRTCKYAPATPYVYAIDWRPVQKEYDGIFIAPYQWTCRMGSPSFWYYCWDCASGCIWNYNIIETLKSPTILDIKSPEKDCSEEETSTDSLLASLVPLT